MSKIINAIRGMNDILPDDIYLWQYIETTLREVFASFGYREIRFPVVEKTQLFKRSIGEVTDIVEKEMYTFEDRNGDSLTLRPEGTAGCVRACIENGLLYNQTQRLWYLGDMFRYERPQKGRYRQFSQFGVEAYGFPGPDIDAELIAMNAHFWRRLGLAEHFTLQINSLGTSEERKNYRQALVSYLQTHEQALDADSQRRLSSNPLRILDSKNPAMQAIISEAPQLLDYLGEASTQHFHQVLRYLDNAAINYEVNPRLVRGLDYYSHTVFEWVTERLGAQNTVSAGGRYDVLVEQLGGKPTPAMGFALGVDRLVVLLQECQQLPAKQTTQVYLIMMGEAAKQQGFKLAETLRSSLPELRLLMHCGGGSVKSQFKKADKSEAQIALIIGEDEAAAEQVTIKYLRETKPQQTLAQDQLQQLLVAHFQ